MKENTFMRGITGNGPVPKEIAIKAMKSICKIIIVNRDYGTGFFVKISDSLKCLITNYHVLDNDAINSKIELEIWTKEKILLNLNNLYIKYFKSPLDITVIEINNLMDYDINYLDYHSIYNQKGYNVYKDLDIFSVHHPLGNESVCAVGKVTNIYGFQFEHNMLTDLGSSGCPIILLNNNINCLVVIGIHKQKHIKNDIGRGTFIGEILDGINKDYKQNNFGKKINQIIADIYVIYSDCNKPLQILNSKNNMEKTGSVTKDSDILEYCEIRINDELITPNYYYTFNEGGIFTIKYLFKNDVTQLSHLFDGCSALVNIDLSNFNTKNVTDMSYMFNGCSSLTNINLSNFDTKNVEDMSNMFEGCSSLISLNLSNFETQNVTNMSYMFKGCSSLKDIDLSNFNTQNVINMNNMFDGCSSLTNLDLSNFNTHKVQYMGIMFRRCSSLKDLNLSNFTTHKYKYMDKMFFGCSPSLNLHLPNFDIKSADIIREKFILSLSLPDDNAYPF